MCCEEIHDSHPILHICVGVFDRLIGKLEITCPLATKKGALRALLTIDSITNYS